jgi:micrococcal nuclease
MSAPGRTAVAAAVALFLVSCVDASPRPTWPDVEAPAGATARAPSGAPGPATRSGEPPTGVPADAQRGVVERIVDGDTLWVRIDDPDGPLVAGATHKIRLLEIDTPETQDPRRGVQCWGPEASAFTKRELPVGAPVFLTRDDQDTDRYGRFLRYVWTGDGTLFNAEAVRQGHARVVLYEPNDEHIELLRAAEEEARAAGRGLWGRCRQQKAQSAAMPPVGTEAPPPPAWAAGPVPDEPCDAAYAGACLPAFAPDLDCSDLAARGFRSVGIDPHGLDRDGDGVACDR